MKTRYLALLAGCLVAGIAHGQTNAPAPGAADPPRPAGRAISAGPTGRSASATGHAAVAIMEVLTPEQRLSFRDTVTSQRAKLSDLENKLASARRELLETELLEKFDEAAVRQKAGAAAEIEVELI